MITNESTMVFFSWEEFGQIVETIAEQIEESVICDSLICLNDSARILTLALAYRLGVPVVTQYHKNSLSVNLDNYTTDPHIAITYYQHTDAENFSLKDPRFHYRSSSIDTEGRKQEVIFPWQKA